MRLHKIEFRLTNQETYKTTCYYCGVGCGIVARKDKLGRLQVEGDKDHPVNKGMLCSKGMNLHYTVNDRTDRLLYPEMRYAKTQLRQRVIRITLHLESPKLILVQFDPAAYTTIATCCFICILFCQIGLF